MAAASAKKEKQEHEQLNRRHHERRRVDTFKEEPGQERVALNDEQADCRANAPILLKGLTWLVVFRQPVAGPRRRQGIGQGAQLFFQCQVS